MTNLSFNQPYWLACIPLMLVFLFLVRYFQIKNSHKKESILSEDYFDGYSAVTFFHPLIQLLSNRDQVREVNSSWEILKILALFCIFVALSDPIYQGKQIPVSSQKRDIVFLVDTSASMGLRDYVIEGQRIDRMSLIKGLLGKFVNNLQDERLSVIVFASRAYTFIPVTQDQKFIHTMLTRIEVTMAGRFKAIGEAIGLAVKQARKSDSKHTLLVLLTDANQPTGRIDVLSAAELAQRSGLPVHTIAIGATSFEAEEYRSSGLVYQTANLSLLKQISNITDAQSFQAGDAKALQEAVNKIKQHGAIESTATPIFYQYSLYYIPLFLAVFCLLSFQIVSLTKARN